MYPHERSLVTRFQDQPFAIVGVNSDTDREALARVVQKENITWRSFWNGPEGPGGPIAAAWNVRGWPTVYVLDDDGVIRYKGHGGERQIDAAIEAALAGAKRATHR